MATYAIGDIQGCYRPFLKLLEALEFDPDTDRLWLVGDLVNRGDGSLETLRYVRDLGETAITILGNHDLNLLALAQKSDALEQANDTLKPILQAPDREALLDWLRHRPLFHHDADLNWSMVHAGLAPAWTLADAARHAREVEQALRAPDYPDFLANMYGNDPDHWDPRLSGWARLRVITNCLTRIRFCHPDGRLDMDYKGPLRQAPAGLLPWFQVPERASRRDRIVFGHWSALEQTVWPEYNVWGIDTGCVWGNSLTALRLDGEPTLTDLPCAQ